MLQCSLRPNFIPAEPRKFYIFSELEGRIPLIQVPRLKYFVKVVILDGFSVADGLGVDDDETLHVVGHILSHTGSEEPQGGLGEDGVGEDGVQFRLLNLHVIALATGNEHIVSAESAEVDSTQKSTGSV